MGNLTKCLGQVTGINQVDRAELEDAYKQHLAKGLSEYDASIATLSGHHKKLFDAVNEMRSQVGKAVVEYQPHDASEVNKRYDDLVAESNAKAGPLEKPVAKVVTAERPDAAKLLNVFTERGTKASIEPKVIDSKDILTSMDEGYPAEFQPRDRSRIASKAQISDIANKLNPEFLGDSPKAGDGRPLVVPVEINGETKYAVISGNGRTAAIREAYAAGNEGSTKYAEFAQSKGGTSENPIYVGILDPKEIGDIPKFAAEANESSTAQMSATEQAKVDAERMTPEVMASFVPSEDGSIHGAANRDFTRAFLETVGPAEQGRLIQPDGSLNQDGVNRVKNAIFAKAFGDTAKGVQAIQRMSESTDDSVKNVTTAMLGVSGPIASYKEAAKKGSRHKEFDIGNDLAAAVAEYAKLKSPDSAFKTLEEYISQGNLFGADTTPFQTRVMQMFDENKRSPKAIKNIIGKFLDIAEAIGDPNQSDLFGKNEKPSAASVFEAAIKEYAKQPAEQPSLIPADQGVQARSGRSEEVPNIAQAAGKSETSEGRDAPRTVAKTDVPEPPKPPPSTQPGKQPSGKPIPPFMRSVVRRELGKGQTPEEVADIYDLDVGEVAALRGIHEKNVGKFGQTSHYIRRALAEDDNAPLINKIAKAVVPQARIHENNPEFADKVTAVNALLDTIASGIGKLRSSQMDKADWNRAMDVFADKWPVDFTYLVHDALAHQEEWYRKLEAFSNDPELAKVMQKVEEIGNLPNGWEALSTVEWGNQKASTLPAEMKKEVRRIGEKYGIEKVGEVKSTGLSEAVVKQRFLESVRKTATEKLAGRISEARDRAADAGKHQESEAKQQGLKGIRDDVQFTIAGRTGLANLGDTQRMMNLETAKKMEAENKDSKTIWLATGFEKGVDGKWRYEIDDSKAHLQGFHKYANDPARLNDVLYFPELFKAYPGLKYLDVKFHEDWPANRRGALGRTPDGSPAQIGINGHLDAGTRLSVLLHETQHAIQDQEGFPRGGGVQTVSKLDKETVHDIAQVEKEIRTAQKLKESGEWVYESSSLTDIIKSAEIPVHIKDWAVGVVKGGDKSIKEFFNETPQQQYHRLAGEVEARNVQTRHYMGPNTRSQVPLSETEDVSRDNQIIRYDKDDVEITDVQFAKLGQLEIARQILRVKGLLNLDRTAEFEFKDGNLIFKNPAAGAIVQEAVEHATERPADGITGLYGHTSFPDAFVEAAEDLYGEKIAKIFRDAIDPVHGDITIIPGFGNPGIAQEEFAHRFNKRSGLRDAMDVSKDDLAGDLNASYANLNIRGIKDEKFAKSLRDDAEAELNATRPQTRAIRRKMYEAAKAANLDLNAFADGLDAISRRGQGLAKYVRRKLSRNEPVTGNSGTPGTDLQSGGEIRGSGLRDSGRPVREDTDRLSDLRRADLLGRVGTGNESLALRDPSDVVFARASREEYDPEYVERESKSALKTALSYIYDGKRDVSAGEAIMNVARTGYLAGVSVIKTNLHGNTAMIATEQLAKPGMALVDILNAKFNPKAKGLRYVPGLSPIDIVDGFFGPTGLIRGGVFGDRGFLNALVKGIPLDEAKKFDMNIAEDRSSFVRNTGVPLFDVIIEGTKRLVVGIDRPFKAFARTTETRGLARIAAKNAKAQGLNDSWRKAMKDYQESPGQLIQDIAERYAEVLTFQNPNPIADVYDTFRKLLIDDKALAKIIPNEAQRRVAKHIGTAAYVATGQYAPFVRTPTNIGFRTMEYFAPTGVVAAAWKFHRIGQTIERQHWIGETAARRAKYLVRLAGVRGRADIEFKAETKKFIDGFNRRKAARLAERDENINAVKQSTVLTDKAKTERIDALKTKYADWVKKWESKRNTYQGQRDNEFTEAQMKREGVDKILKKEWDAEDVYADVKFTAFENRNFAETAGRAGFGATAGGLALLAVIYGLMDAVGVTDYDEEKGKWYAKRAAGIPDSSVRVGKYRFPFNNNPFGNALNMGVNLFEQYERPGGKLARTGAMTKTFAKDVADLNPLTNREFDKDDWASWAGSKANSMTPIVNMKIFQEIGEVIDEKPRKYWEEGFAAQYMIKIPKLREQLPASNPKNYIGQRGDFDRRLIRMFDPLKTTRELKSQKGLPKTKLK